MRRVLRWVSMWTVAAVACLLLTVSTVATYFFDVDSGDWYATAVEFTVEKGLLAEATPGRFSPDGLTTRVESAEGNLSTLTQTADSLAARVYNTEMGLTSINVTANKLETRVEDLNGKYSSLQQTVDGFDFTGMVTFRALEREGESVINGNNITTGDLHVASDGVGALYFYNGDVAMENIVGAIEVYSGTYPDLFIESRYGNNIRIQADAQLALEAGYQGHIYMKADDYIQLRAGGVDYYFRADGIYRGEEKIL